MSKVIQGTLNNNVNTKFRHPIFLNLVVCSDVTLKQDTPYKLYFKIIWETFTQGNSQIQFIEPNLLTLKYYYRL